jgi:uncharacterized protein DUF3574
MISQTPGLKFPHWRAGCGRRAAVLALMLAVASAGALQAQEPACPFDGQKPMLVIQMFFGRSVPHRHPVTMTEWNKFLKDTVTPQFPDGYTVYDAYGQWLSPTTHSVSRDPTKVVVIATADTPEVHAKVAEVSKTYRQMFHQESVGVISLTECGAF